MWQKLASPALHASTTTRCLDCRDVDLSHLHHRIERSLGSCAIGIGYRLYQSQWSNLPREAPFVFAPAARTLFATVANDRVPVTISFCLVRGCDLKGERFAMLEVGSAIEPETGNPHDSKLDCQNIPLLSGWKVSRCAMYRTNRRIREGLCVKTRRLFGAGIVPKANCVLCLFHHVKSPCTQRLTISITCPKKRSDDRSEAF